MGSQLATEQLGITSRDEYAEVCTKQTVDKQIPSVNILNLVEQKIGHVCTIQLIDARQHRIQIHRLHVSQAVVVKVYVPISYTMFQQHLMAKR